MLEATLTVPKLRRFRQLLQRWYAREQRMFIWRVSADNPYIILLSEFMLQQTQATRVDQLLPIFLKRFPTLRDLAKATNAEVIVAWQGLGYNSRALRLRDCARSIISDYDRQIPQSMEQLRALPGIGPYTASALCVFAFGQNLPVLDVNIRRVYSRVCAPMTDNNTLIEEKTLNALAERIYPRGSSSDWHQAVMDLGAQICTARSPACARCPLTAVCASAFTIENVRRAKKAEPSHRNVPNRIWRGRIVEALRRADGHTLTQKRILRQLFDDSTRDDELWIEGIVLALKRDGLVTSHRSQIRLAQ